jgi:hypothetical protein
VHASGGGAQVRTTFGTAPDEAPMRPKLTTEQAPNGARIL